MMKVYLAGPFFNEQQLSRIQLIEGLCVKHNLEGMSPRKFLVLPPKASWLDRKKVFEDNLRSMDQADLVLAGLDDPDTGTHWEMGWAFANAIPVVGYMLTEGKKMNVMLAQGCNGFLNSYEKIDQFLKGHATGYQGMDTGVLWDFNWHVAEEWMKDIY